MNVPRNVTTAVGQTAFLHCRVHQLGDKEVSGFIFLSVTSGSDVTFTWPAASVTKKHVLLALYCYITLSLILVSTFSHQRCK
ncbi:hypothetical protein E2986_12304 [Frieseomelitta varia]|uniref:Uncharacterized protein n=1 Tax=Frieseomelitta varia TaxID=561572 RepID=A0A833W0T4_9HYME|nr:hypothetical protein E2986_12304 [Frieseomelitta varia]